MICLTIVAAGALDLGHGIIITRSHIGVTMGFFLKHRLRVISLKLGVEVSQTLGTTVGPTPSIGERVVSVLHFHARSAPVTMEASAR